MAFEGAVGVHMFLQIVHIPFLQKAHVLLTKDNSLYIRGQELMRATA